MTNIENLQKYVDEDLVFQSYLKNNDLSKFNDFDKFCIEHCRDIMTLIQDYESIKDFYNHKISELNNIIDNQNKIINDLQNKK